MSLNRPVFPLKALICLFVLALLTTGAVPKKEKTPLAPKFPPKSVWINTGGLVSPKVYQNKVTLVYFWDYTSVNSLREIDDLKRWFNHYEKYGFQMIWAHAPEFEFSKDRVNVEKAVARLGIPYPVLLDSSFKLWDDFKVKSWPSKFLVNSKRQIVHGQTGESGYLLFEEKIREELLKLHPDAKLPPPIFEGEPDLFSLDECGPMIAETYLGFKRASWWGGQIANKQWVSSDQTVTFKDRGERVERGFFVEGSWKNAEDYFEHARNTKLLEDYVGMIYLANEVYAVMHLSAGEAEPHRVYVTRDDVPVPENYRGQDLRTDEQGRTFVLLDQPRLYYLIANDDLDQHELKVWSMTKGTAVNSFSFSNYCLSQFEHL